MKNPSPSPQYTPREVVRIQLEALRQNDQPAPDSGIATAYKFASPRNREKTGPLEKFIRMVKGPEYGLMVNHQSAEYGQLQAEDAQAQQLVKITASGGEVALYVFILSRQSDGPYKDCWMTDGVIRLRPENVVPVPAAPPAEPGTNGDGHDKA